MIKNIFFIAVLVWGASTYGSYDIHDRLNAIKAEGQEEPEGDLRLHVAAAAGDLASVEACIAAGSDVNALDEGSSTPLHYAALSGHYDVCAHLLAHKASVGGEDIDGYTPLANSLLMGYDRISMLLVAHGADLKNHRWELTPEAAIIQYFIYPALFTGHNHNIDDEEADHDTSGDVVIRIDEVECSLYCEEEMPEQ